MNALLFSVFLFFLTLSGCSLQEFGSSFQASNYFALREYDKGIMVFKEKVKENPQNAFDNYYLGRFFMAENKPQRALPYLREAVLLTPNNTDYQFWLGVCFGVVGDEKEERRQYEKVLKLSSSHIQARLYLAHLQLKNKQYGDALNAYDKVLDQYSYNAAALYNRALCLKFTRQIEEEREAWLEYLKWYPSGYLAAKAADHLNRLGDFSYRNHQFGFRNITLKNIRFTPETDEIRFDSRPSLKLAGAVLSNFSKGDLQITVFTSGNGSLAKNRALKLKSFLLQEYPNLKENTIKLSWFATPEKLYGHGNEFLNDHAVRIYMTNWK